MVRAHPGWKPAEAGWHAMTLRFASTGGRSSDLPTDVGCSGARPPRGIGVPGESDGFEPACLKPIAHWDWGLAFEGWPAQVQDRNRDGRQLFVARRRLN